MKKLFFSLILAFIALTVTSQNYRDVVFLKDGSIIKGFIIEQIPSEHLKIETSGGSLFVYSMNEVEKISKEKNVGISNRNSNFSSSISKGRISISGKTNLSFASLTNEVKINSEIYGGEMESDISQFSFEPSLSYFVADGFAVGLSIDYESRKQNDDETEEKESSLMAGPIATYYFGTTNIKPFLHAEYMFGNETYESDNDETSFKMNGWGIGAGVAFFLNQSISLDLGLAYAQFTGEPKDSAFDIEYTNKGFTVNGGVSVYF